MPILHVIHRAFEDRPVHVADVDVDVIEGDLTSPLELAYTLTNNIHRHCDAPEDGVSRRRKSDGSWSRDDLPDNLDRDARVTVMAPLPVSQTGVAMGLRSTSMGDAMVMDGQVYEVAMMGFRQIGSLTDFSDLAALVGGTPQSETSSEAPKP